MTRSTPYYLAVLTALVACGLSVVALVGSVTWSSTVGIAVSGVLCVSMAVLLGHLLARPDWWEEFE